MDVASIFKGMKDAKPGGGGNYFPTDFKGRVRVQRFFLNRGFQQDTAIIAELEILTSNKPDIQPGMSRTWYQGKLDDRQIRDTALGEVCGFVAAALGIPLTEKAKEEIEGLMPQLVGEQNPLGGRELDVETWTKMTKKGTAFTKHRFTAVAQ